MSSQDTSADYFPVCNFAFSKTHSYICIPQYPVQPLLSLPATLHGSSGSMDDLWGTVIGMKDDDDDDDDVNELYKELFKEDDEDDNDDEEAEEDKDDKDSWFEDKELVSPSTRGHCSNRQRPAAASAHPGSTVVHEGIRNLALPATGPPPPCWYLWYDLVVMGFSTALTPPPTLFMTVWLFGHNKGLVTSPQLQLVVGYI